MLQRSLLRVLTALVIPVIACSAADAMPPPAVTPAPRLENAYTLGLDAYLPSAEIIALDETVKKHPSDVKGLSELAASTRHLELSGYQNAVVALNRLGAPAVVQKPYMDAVKSLSRPIVVPDQTASMSPSDEESAQIVAILHEADAITPSETALLTPWLKLAQGRDGLWAYRVGCLIAVTRAAIPCKPNNLPLIDGASSLADGCPPGTPDVLSNALQQLADQVQRRRVSALTVEAVDRAAETVFESGH